MNKIKSVIVLLFIIIIASCASTETVENFTPAKDPKPIILAEEPKLERKQESDLETGFIVDINKYGNCTTSLKWDDLKAKNYEYGDVFRITLGSKTFEAPLVSSYSDVDLAHPLIRAIDEKVELAINLGNIAQETGVAVGSTFTYELVGKGEYAEEYLIRQLVKSDNIEDYSSDEVFANFRPVVTTGIAEGKLYRSCSPILPNTTRTPYAYNLMKKAEIKAVINLANTEEEAIKYSEQYPFYNDLLKEGKVIALGMNVDYNSKDFTTKLKSALLFLIEQESPVLIHCNEGKDRAGLVIAILEALSGASMDEIVEDYVLSFENYYHIEKGSEQYNKISSIIIDFFTDINGGTPVGQKPLNATLNYLKNVVNVDVNDLNTLRNMLRY